MFARPKSKPSLLPLSNKRKRVPAIEEITFDPHSREDYLTGFHKRKLQRIKHAKDEAIKREREERLTARKILREGRKTDLEKHVEAVNSMLREQDDLHSDSSESLDVAATESWEGIPEDTTLDREDEYVDDDRFATVTVEAVDVSKDGVRKSREDEDTDDDIPDIRTPRRDDLSAQAARSRSTSKRGSKEPFKGARKKKKKFRYESKAERKVTRLKEKSGNKAKAKARRT